MKSALLLITLAVLTPHVLGGGWTYRNNETVCHSELVIKAEGGTKEVKKAIETLERKYLVYPPNGEFVIGKKVYTLDGFYQEPKNLQEMWDVLSEKIIEQEITIVWECQNSNPIINTGTIYLTGFTHHRINIVGRNKNPKRGSLDDPVNRSNGTVCKFVWQMEEADAMDISSADVTDMRAAIVVENAANIAMGNFHFVENDGPPYGPNNLLTVGLWVQDGARVFNYFPIVTNRTANRNRFRTIPESKSSLPTRTPTPTPTITPGKRTRTPTPTPTATPTNWDSNFAIVFEKFFAGAFVSNFAQLRMARRHRQGGIKCILTYTCVAAERMALAELDFAEMQGANTGAIKAAGLLARGNSLILADGATIAGYWTGAMAREGSGIRVQNAIFDGFVAPIGSTPAGPPGDISSPGSEYVGYRMDFAVRAGEGSYAVAHGAKAFDIVDTTVAVSSNAAFVASSFESWNGFRETKSCIAAEASGVALVKKLHCETPSKAAVHAYNGGVVIAPMINTVIKGDGNGAACAIAHGAFVLVNGTCSAVLGGGGNGIIVKEGGIGLVDGFNVTSKQACAVARYGATLGKNQDSTTEANFACQTSNTTATNAAGSGAAAIVTRGGATAHIGKLYFTPSALINTTSTNPVCFVNRQSSSQHIDTITLQGVFTGKTCDHDSMWESTYNGNGTYDVCL